MVKLNKSGEGGHKHGITETFRSHGSSGVQLDRTTTRHGAKRIKTDKQMALRSYMNDIPEEAKTNWDKMFPKKISFCEYCMEKIEHESSAAYISGKMRSFCSWNHLKEYKEKLKEGYKCEWCGRPVFKPFTGKLKELYCSRNCAQDKEDWVE